ncbi:MAG: DNA primase [Clostridia bacterium]|nr:DNA primase [Clostridia bacterium]
MIPRSFIDELLDRCNIVDVISPYVRLKKSGANYLGLCPFHNEKTPSFTVSAEKQLYKCFGCGAGGNAIGFIMQIENLEFIDAVKKLADSCGMTVPENDDPAFNIRKRVLEANVAAARFWRANLSSDKGKAAAEYLIRRGLSPKIVQTFGIGYATDGWFDMTNELLRQGFTRAELEAAKLSGKGKNGGYFDFFRDRVMFPIINERGDVIAFSGRVLTSGAEGRKYINSSDTPAYSKSRALYGIHLAKRTKEDFLLLVEGNMDVVALHQAGFDNAIATCGTALTPQQAQLMRKTAAKAVICFDQDEAGKKATDKAIDILTQADIEVRVLRLPPVRGPRGEILLDAGGKPVKDDPDSFIKRNGADSFRQLLQKPPSDIEYKLSTIKSAFDLNTDDGRIGYLKEAAKYLAGIPSDIEREIHTRNTARSADLSESALIGEVARIRSSRLRDKKRKIEQASRNPLAQAQPKERGIHYTNPASAISEERLLQLCLSDTKLLDSAGDMLEAEQFSSPLLGSIFQKAVELRRQGEHVSPASLLLGLEDNETRHLSAVLTQALPSADPKTEIQDCIKKINFEYIKRSGNGDDLFDLILAQKRSRGK